MGCVSTSELCVFELLVYVGDVQCPLSLNYSIESMF